MILAKDAQIASLKKLVTDMFTYISNYGYMLINNLKGQVKSKPVSKEEIERGEGTINTLMPSSDMLDGYEDLGIPIKQV